VSFFSSTEDSGHGILDSSTEDIMLNETKGGTYLSLDEIGVFLSHLANNGIYLNCFLLQYVLVLMWLSIVIKIWAIYIESSTLQFALTAEAEPLELSFLF